MTNATAYIANEMTTQIGRYAAFAGVDFVTPVWFNNFLNALIVRKGFTFETAMAESMFKTAVARQIDRDVYGLVFPKVGMDENGEYTTDSTKWA